MSDEQFESENLYELDAKYYICPKTGEQKFGFLIEDVEEFCPEIMIENRRISYKLLVVYLVEEIKKLRSDIDNLL